MPCRPSLLDPRPQLAPRVGSPFASLRIMGMTFERSTTPRWTQLSAGRLMSTRMVGRRAWSTELVTNSDMIRAASSISSSRSGPLTGTRNTPLRLPRQRSPHPSEVLMTVTAESRPTGHPGYSTALPRNSRTGSQ